MIHAKSTGMLWRYFWSIAIALLGLVTLSSSLFSETLAPASATLTLSIMVTNDNGGQAMDNDFQAMLGGNNVAWGANSVDAGLSPVSVNAPSGYSTSGWSGNCEADGTIQMLDGGSYACSITYDDVAPTLKLVKLLTNDNGGTAMVDDFQAKIDGNNVNWGAATPLNVGTHTASETSLSGYTASSWGGACASNGTITLALGQVAECTITNNDIAPTLKLVKTVTNNNGGTATANHFQAKINGNNVNWDVATPLNVGTHTASETGLSGYTASSWGGDCASNGSITLTLGQTATCIITNDDIAPTLRLVKTVQNNNGGTADVNSFQAKIDGNDVDWGEVVLLNVGNHTASETSLSGYTASSWSGACASNGSITLALGQTAECSITNDDVAPTLRLVKTVQNNNGGTADVNSFQAKIDGNNVDWGVAIPLSPGVHSASETSLPGYTASSWGGACQANGSITLALGQTATCSITNSDTAATLELRKTVVNDNGGTATVNNFQAEIDNSNVAWDKPIPVLPGQHTASEVNVPGYVASVWASDCAADGKVTVALGENKVCTIINDDAQATLIVIKKVINDHGGTLLTAAQFNLRVTNNNANPITFAGSEAGTTVSLSPGTYTVSETPPDGYNVTYSSGCVQEPIGLGETKTCTVTNNDAPARLKIVKQVVNDNGGTLSVADFALLIDGVPVTSGTFITVAAGLHTVGEIPNPRYAATFSGNCTGGQVTVSLGQSRTCTLTNNDKPLGITLQKTASSTSVQPGTVVIYSYSVGNTATVPLTNISVMDDSCKPVQPVNTNQTNSGDTNQDNILDPGEEWKYTCTATLQLDTVNIAKVEGTPIGGGQPVTDTAQVAVDVRASIQVTKTASTLSVPPAGGVVNFTLKIRNLSPGDLVTIQSLQDDIYGNITDSNNPKLQTTNCVTPRAIAKGAVYTCTFTVFLSGTLGQQHVNTVLATGNDDDDQPVSGSASATVQIAGSLLQPTKSAALVIDADQNGVASPGDTLEYTVGMQNKGNAQAAGIVFQDTPDANTTLVSGSVQTSRGTITTGNTPGDTLVSINVGTINPNVIVTIRFKVKINDPLPASATQVTNQGSISGQTIAQTFTDDPNTLAVGDATITPLTVAPLITGVKTVRLFTDADSNGAANADDSLEYKITITNQGNRAATGVVLNDTVDAQTVLEVGSVQTNRGVVVKGNQPGDSAVQVDVGDLPGSSSAEITLRVTLKNPLPAGVTQVSNQGFISGGNFPTTATDDPTTPASNDPTKLQVTIGPALDATKLATLSIDVDQNGQPDPGDTLHYQVRIMNSGNQATTGVAFVDKLDENTTLVVGSVTTTQGDVTRGNGAADREVNVNLNNIDTGGEVIITYKAQINNPLPPTVLKVVNQGLVTSQELPPVPTDDPTTPAVDDSTQTQVRLLPQIDATKRATLLIDNDNDQVAEPGDTLLYEVALVNNGNATATAVTFGDTVDANTTLVPNSVQSSQGTVQSGNNPGDAQVQVDVGTLAGNGAAVNISYRVTINNPLPAQTVEVANQGTVQSVELNPVQTDDPATSAASDATRTQVVASPRLHVIKQDLLWIDADDDRQVTSGDQLLYQIKIINTGNLAATNVTLQDTIDARTALENNTVQTSQGNVQQGNVAGEPSVVIAVGAIPPNGVVNIGFRVRVNVNENGHLSNQATVIYDQPAPAGTRNDPIRLLSDDPDTAESSDPTLTPIVRKGSGQGAGSLRIYMPIVRR